MEEDARLDHRACGRTTLSVRSWACSITLVKQLIEYRQPEAPAEDEETRPDHAFPTRPDPVRRGIVARLSRGPASVGELAAPYPVTLQAVSRHIAVLEQAGLVTRSRDGQRRPVHLRPAALEELTAWIDGYRLTHERAFRRLDALLATGAGEEAARRLPRPRRCR